MTGNMETTPVDPVAEWAASGGDIGLEEPKWQLGLGATESYPVTPDCIYYLKPGFCGLAMGSDSIIPMTVAWLFLVVDLKQKLNILVEIWICAGHITWASLEHALS